MSTNGVAPRTPVPLQLCTLCPRLVQTRANVVPPRILRGSAIMMVGQAPGKDEDGEGKEPFVGRAGQLLQRLCLQVGLEWSSISLANTVCCRPTRVETGKWGDRTVDDEPTPVEIKNCAHNLDSTIRRANPRILVPVGKPALKRLTGRASIMAMNGMVLEDDRYPGMDIIPMIHPAAVLRSPGYTKELLFALEQIRKCRDYETVIRPGTYRAARTIEDFREMLEELRSCKRFAFDVEASGIRDFQNVWVVTMSFCTAAGTGWTLPWRLGTPEFYEAVKADRNRVNPKTGKAVKPTCISNVFEFADNNGIADPGFKYYWVDYPEVWEGLNEIFRSNKLKIMHNASYDTKVIQNGYEFQGFTVAPPIRDTMDMHYLLEGQKTRHSLENLIERFTTMGNFKKAVKEWVRYSITDKSAGDSYAIIPPEDLYTYNAGDTDATLRVHDQFWPKLMEMRPSDPIVPGRRTVPWNMLRFLDEMIMPVKQILIRAEEWGVNMDEALIDQADIQLSTQIENKNQEIYRACSVQEFNTNSTKQLREIFYDRLKFPILNRTPTGKPSTDEGTMKMLMQKIKHPAPKLLMEQRTMVKLYGTYVVGIKKRMYTDRRLHCHFNTCFTDTGRLSSDDPNLENIPRPRPNEVNVKNFFIPTYPGWKIVAVDFSQAELRVSAWEAQDDVAIQMFLDGRDIHNEVGCQIFGLPPGSRCSKEQRVITKGINFGIIYGLTAKGLKDDLAKEGVRVTMEQAQGYLDAVWNNRPKLKSWIDKTIARAHANEYVEAASGRRNYLLQINSEDEYVRSEAERKGINMPIQSWASDLMLWSALRIEREVQKRGLTEKVKIWNFVHDQLVWEMPDDLYFSFIKEIAIPNMTEWTSEFFGFPFLAEAEVGDRWGELLHCCLECGELSEAEECPKCTARAIN